MTAFVVVLLLLLLAVTVLGAAGLPGSSGEAKATWARAKKAFGLDSWPTRVVGPIVAVWAGVALVFLSALFWLPVFLWRHDFGAAEDPTWDLRWTFIALAAVTAALSAVIALPFTLLRTRYNSRQTDAQEEGLLTDRINKAVEGLGAQKEVNRLGRTVTFAKHLDENEHEEFEERILEWEDQRAEPPPGTYSISYGEWQPIAQTLPNLEVRIGAIYALERIAQRNIDEVHVQIMEILCAYIRENAPAPTTDDAPEDWLKASEDDGPLEDDWEERKDKYEAELREWLQGVEPRTDIQVALEVIGRRTPEQREAEALHGGTWTKGFVFDRPPDSTEADAQTEDCGADMRAEVHAWKRDLYAYSGYRLDLRRTDLRGANLTGLNLAGGKLGGAQLQGAWLVSARLQGAEFDGARLQGARLGGVRLQGARLSGAWLQAAWLGRARLHGAEFVRARLQGAELGRAQLQGAKLGWARLQGVLLDRARLQGAELGRARLQGARLDAAGLQGADLVGARLQGAMLDGAGLQGAELVEAGLQGALLEGARLQGTRLDKAGLQRAFLDSIELDSETSLTVDSSWLSAVRSSDFTWCSVEPRFFEEAFGDGSVKGLPEGYVAGQPPLEHWARDKLDNKAFHEAWRAWQVKIGVRKPDNPS